MVLALAGKAAGQGHRAPSLAAAFITVAESADISPLALKALANHSLGNDVTSGYALMTAERLRERTRRVVTIVLAAMVAGTVLLVWI